VFISGSETRNPLKVGIQLSRATTIPVLGLENVICVRRVREAASAARGFDLGLRACSRTNILAWPWAAVQSKHALLGVGTKRRRKWAPGSAELIWPTRRFQSNRYFCLNSTHSSRLRTLDLSIKCSLCSRIFTLLTHPLM
jgi:hypothetical protein